jgi:hypothetical protein
MTPDLTEDDKAALIELLRETIERDRFPLSPKVKRRRAREEAAEVDDTCYRRSTVTIPLSI